MLMLPIKVIKSEACRPSKISQSPTPRSLLQAYMPLKIRCIVDLEALLNDGSAFVMFSVIEVGGPFLIKHCIHKAIKGPLCPVDLSGSFLPSVVHSRTPHCSEHCSDASLQSMNTYF